MGCAKRIVFALRTLGETGKPAAGPKRADALAAVGTAAAAKAILDNFENKRGDLQYMSEEVAELLGELGANAIQAIPLLERMLSEDANPSVRSKAAVALALVAGPAALGSLERELRKGDARLRTYTAVALGRVPDQRAIPILIECLNDAEASVRWCAAKSLGQVGDDSALEPLRRALADSSEDVRANAEEAIEKIISGFRDSPE